MAVSPDYDKLLDPISDITASIEALLAGAFGSLMGDQRVGLNRIYVSAWGLHTLFMDIITSLGIENIANRDYLQEKFDDYLHPIINQAQSLLDDYDGPLNEEQEVAVDYIRDSGMTLRAYVNDLWLYSQIRHGKVRMVTEQIELQDLFFRPSMPVSKDDVPLKVHYEDKLPKIQGDFVYLQRCIHQLVANAIHYTKQGSIKVDVLQEKSDLIIRVEDSGTGIDEKYHNRIFEPFFQINPRHNGIGLGLSIARGIVLLHRGTIVCHSIPGTGTTITLTLPTS